MPASHPGGSASVLRAPLVGSAVILAALTAAFLLLSFFYLRPGIVERDVATARDRLRELLSEGERYFDEVEALTAQLPSRTAIRDALARSLAGEQPREEVAAFTTPRIGDAVEASALLLGVVRIDRAPVRPPLVRPLPVAPPPSSPGSIASVTPRRSRSSSRSFRERGSSSDGTSFPSTPPRSSG